ncbi:beta-N-acetylhexosaminidase [Neptuniibacter sp. PT8_73]|uniref:beta-N-acetylhexosaminidase n=1 Tax=Neptuniibacter sp. PT8_73 TaxID=3398206 RepID=UPI0039F4D41C
MSEVTLFLDLEGTVLTAEEKDLLKHPFIGGVILFARNTENAEQVATLVASMRSIREELVISIDQEGGRVQRLKKGVTVLPPVKAISKKFSVASEGVIAAKELGYLMAAELRQLDVDLSFAPVLDVDYGRNTVIGNRAFGEDYETVTEISAAYIDGMRSAGMSATGKHFPGHGWADADTHHADAVDGRSFEELWKTDMVPFRQAVDNKLEAMMFAHVLYPECDSSPAGFSNFWLGETLRKKIGFGGIIFSDDLSMKAAHSAGSYAERAGKAIASGCQALLCCNERRGTLDILKYLEASDFKPLQEISSLRGKQWNRDGERLDAARVLANDLLDVAL